MRFVPFIVAGFPTIDIFKDVLFLLEKEGAAYIEVGVPFSDPLADGPVIQAAYSRAINDGITLRETLTAIGNARNEGLLVPIILFTYYNPLLKMGLEQLARELANNNINGILVPDLPFEESVFLKKAVEPYNIPVISLITPTSKERIKAIIEQAEGFIYVVSSLGVTGERVSFHRQIEDLVKEIKAIAKIPVILGFGISNYSQVKYLEKYIDGYVIGSALIKKMQEIDTESKSLFIKHLQSYIREVTK